MAKEVKLKVLEAFQEEAYKGIVRIDSQTMKDINVHPGDIVEIEGNRITVAVADRSYPTDIGQSVIRMDGIIRRNAKTGIGEAVKVRRAEIKEAKNITIAPVQEGVTIQADPYIFKRGLLGRPVVKGDVVAMGGARRRRRTMTGSPFEEIFDVFEEGFMGSFGFGALKFVVVNTNPKIPVIITEETSISLNPKAVSVSEEEKVPDVNYEDIGGLSEEVKKIREMVEIPLKYPEVFSRLGIEPPKGVLLFGPPGTGKTLIAKAVASESEANFILLNGPEIINKFYGESERKVREIFEEAEKNAPSIIFIDEIDAIAPKREAVHGEVERRVVSTLLTALDGLKSRGKVVVIAATNRPNSLDPALRRPGRFDREITIGVPGRRAREEILKIHTRNMPLKKDVKLNRLAEITHGFVGADLAALCREAAINVLRKVLPDLKKLKEGQNIPEDLLNKLVINDKDFKEALKSVRPSALREIMVESPNVSWEEIGGLDNIKQELKESVELPLKSPEVFKRLGIRPTRGILLYGPPGTGKTLLAKAIASVSESNFILVKGPELLDKFIGESEKGVRQIFEKARQVSPTIIFFDEIDALAPRRGLGSDGTRVTERVVNTLLAEMDGLEDLTDVLVIAATNRPDIIDPALLRPGRFDKILLTTPPDKKSREKILEIHTIKRKMPLSEDVSLSKLADQTPGFVGADIEALCREAALLALREDLDAKEVGKKHFDEALKKVNPSVDKETLDRYEEIEKAYLKNAKAGLVKEVPSYFG
nr:CDC48 family AAA ATPase [Candidatus Woesearchaeota archaeon]